MLGLTENVLRIFTPHVDYYRIGHRSLREMEDAGFDLYCPMDRVVQPGETVFLGLGVYIEACRRPTNRYKEFCSPHLPLPSLEGIAVLLLPRSSLAKTPLRLANSVGLIDKGYRGEIMAAVTNTGSEPFTVYKGTRYFQLVAPDTVPFAYVDQVPTLAELRSSHRMSGGFGSTGR